MSKTEDRLRKLISDNLDLDHEPDFDQAFKDSGASSLQVIAFYKLVDKEFELGLVADECTQFNCLRDLVSFIDARAA